jgi:hypothetical protein
MWGCIPAYSQQCGRKGVSLSTINSVGVMVYPCLQSTVWMWGCFPFPPAAEGRMSKYPFPPASSVDVQGVSLFHHQHCRRAGCIPFHRLQCGRAGCIYQQPLQCGRGGCIPLHRCAGAISLSNACSMDGDGGVDPTYTINSVACRVYPSSPPAVKTWDGGHEQLISNGGGFKPSP